MKEKHGEFFLLETNSSVMVLKRYDDAVFKINLAEISPSEYIFWITEKSTKPVDKLSEATFQMTAQAEILSVCIIFVDFSKPKIASESSALIKLMNELKPQFEARFKFAWTDLEYNMQKRHSLGITWDELPAIGINSMQRIDFAYPQGQPFGKDSIVKWLKEVSHGDAKENSLRSVDFAK